MLLLFQFLDHGVDLAEAVDPELAIVLEPRVELVERLRPLGYTVQTSESPAALAARVREETPRWESLVRASGARLD